MVVWVWIYKRKLENLPHCVGDVWDKLWKLIGMLAAISIERGVWDLEVGSLFCKTTSTVRRYSAMYKTIAMLMNNNMLLKLLLAYCD